MEQLHRQFQEVLYRALTRGESPTSEYHLNLGTLAAVRSIASAHPDATPRHIVMAYDTFRQENI